MDALNRSFEIPGIAQLVTGNGGLRKLCVTASSASAEIYLYGAQVTSWQPHGETQVLFLS
jgi:glucose-6-phosphate 1-epimerase